MIQKHHFGTVWHHMAKIICIVPGAMSLNQRINILSFLTNFGFLDVAVVYEDLAGGIQVVVFTSVTGRFSIYSYQVDQSLMFPDKLRSMDRYQYKIIVYDQPPRVKIKNNVISTPLLYFLQAVTSVQNSRLYLTVIDDYHLMRNLWYDKKMHLTLNTGVIFNHPEPKLLTYEESGYCALVPLPPKIPLFQSIFIKPFDGLTWMFLVITTACSVIVWWMFRGRGAVDSPWLLCYGMFVMFIGQGVDFSRRNRLVLTILLQLIIGMIWIVSNAYEGVITSFMIQPIHENRIETFDDLVASDYEIMTDEVFVLKMSGSEAYKILEPRVNSSGQKLGSEFAYEVMRQHYVFVMKCDRTELLIDESLTQSGRKISEFYYLMPQKFLLHLEQLEASFLNPFLERFQYYMDLSFQAGLMQIWKVFDSLSNPGKKTDEPADAQAYLKLEDLTQVFSILVTGYAISIVVLLIEIFFHDFLKKLELANLARRLRNRVNQMAYKRKQPRHPKYQKGALYYIIHRRKRVKRLQHKKLKVRRIYVQPRFPVD